MHEFLYCRNNGALKINFPSDEHSNEEFLKQFSGPDIVEELKRSKNKFINIDLTRQRKEDRKRLDFIRIEARRLRYAYDTMNILKVHFTNENTYDQFVELVTVMQEDLHKRYMFYQDDFYIIGEAPPEPVNSALIIKPFDI
ncbi:hypothetical protein BH10BAC2_BH10BAC2_01710 [soil metagenome]